MALTPEEQAELGELTQLYNQQRQEQTGIADRFSRGVDLLQSTGGAALQATGEALGIESLAETGEEIKLEQREEAEREAPDVRNLRDEFGGALGDILVETSPTLGVLGASTGVGFAVGGPPGALVGLGLSALGLNIGTAKEIEEALDPESKSNLATLAIGGAATIPDILTGGAISQTAKKGLIGATKAALAKEIAKDTVIGTAAAVASQGILEAGATVNVGADFDDDRIEAMADNILMTAGLSGLTANVASTGGVAAGRLLKNQVAFEDAHSPIQFDRDGNISYQAPNPAAVAAPSSLKDNVSSIGLGRAVDGVNRQAGDNVGIRDITSEFDMTFTERADRVGKRSINTESQIMKADMQESAGKFELQQLSKNKRAQVKEDIVTGVKTPEADRVRAAFKSIRERAVKAGLKVGDLGDTYLPFLPNIKKIKADPKAFIEDMVDAGANKEKVTKYVNEMLGDGSLRLGDEVQIPKSLLKAVEEAATGNKEKLQKPFRDVNRLGKINSNNNLEMHRFLSEVPPERLQAWAKDADLLDILDVYTQSVSDRIAYANRFGANNEVLHERLRLSALEGFEKGKPLSVDAIKSTYDLANLQQRLTSETVTPEMRDRIAAVKTTLNYMTLPLATIASLMEPFFLLPKTGAKPFVKGGFQTLEANARKVARIFVKSVPRGEWEKTMAELNSSFREAQSTTAARLGDTNINPSKMDSILFKYNLLSAWTEFSRTWAQFAAIDSFKDFARKAGDPSVSQRDRRKAAQHLAEAGLDPEGVIQWIDKGASKTDPFYQQIRAGAIDVAEDVVFNPKPANKPVWTSQPTFWKQMFSHLKTFPIQFNNRMMIPVYERMVGNGLVGNMEQAIKTGIMTSIALTGFMGLDAMKTMAREGSLDAWEDKEPREKLVSALSQFGSASLAIDPLNANSFGGSPVEAVAGPFASKVSGAVADIGDVIAGRKSPEDLVEDVIRALPNIGGSRDVLVELVE